MKFRTHRHFLSHISYFISYLDYLGGYGLGVARVVQAPVFMGEDKKAQLWGFRKAG